MTYLLDTHIIIWALTDTKKLSSSVKDVLVNPVNNVLVSTISFWEISLKYSLSKMTMEGLHPQDVPSACIMAGYNVISASVKTMSTYHQLTAQYHKDPFDRMLIWQAIDNGLMLISCDDDIHRYTSEGLKVVWSLLKELFQDMPCI